MNMYWSVYENLESEVLALADNIMFDDAQLKVYSLKIGDLIVRCAVEIESISKELYFNESGVSRIDENGKPRKPYFDYVCLKHLIDKWLIDKKKLQITSYKMNLSAENSVLFPLLNVAEKPNSKKVCEWKQAYHAIKHDRAFSQEQANIKNLLNALGALYILNLYYRNESFWFNIPINTKAPYVNQSKIFTPNICDIAKQHCVLLDSDNIDSVSADWLLSLQESMESSIYVKRYTADAVYQQRKWYVLLILNSKLDGTTEEIFNLPRSSSAKDIINEMRNGEHLEFAQTVLKTHSMFAKNESVNYADRNQTTEIILNKNLPVYPEQNFKEFWETADLQKILKDFENRIQKN